MKKIKFICTVLVVVLGSYHIGTAQVKYQKEFTFAGVNYLLSPKGTAMVMKGQYAGQISIPEKIKHDGYNYSVTEIGYSAFENDSNLTAVKLPNSLTSIGGRAFENCFNLKAISIPSSVENIHFGAFAKCRSLISINIPQHVRMIEDYAFSFCEKLESITVDSNNSYFSSNDGVLYNKAMDTLIKVPETKREYVFPKTVAGFSSGAFEHCRFLKHVDLPETVSMIPQNAFDECWGLTEFYIHKNINAIRMNAFRKCKNLKAIVVDGNNKHFASVDGVLYNHDKTRLIHCPATKESINIEPSTQTITSNAFFKCMQLSEIVLPEQVTRIESEAFNQCMALKNVKVLSKVPVKIVDAPFIGNRSQVTVWVHQELIDGYKSSNQLAVKELSYKPL